MALALDHFFRAGIITLGSLVVIPLWRYESISMDKVVMPLNLNDNNDVASENNDAPIIQTQTQVDTPNTSTEDITTSTTINNKNLEELNKKIKNAGIDDSCKLQDLKTPQVCTLNEDQLKNINLPNKDEFGDDSELTIEGLESPKTLTLTIAAGYLEDDFPEGLRFTLKNTNSDDVEIEGDGKESTLKPNIDYDYKISLANTKEDKTWLDNAWSSISHLGKRVGINMSDAIPKECTTSDGNNNKINVWKSESEYVIGADPNDADTCPMDHEEDIEGYLEGFRLKVSEDSDIPLTGGEGPTNGTKIEKITKSGVTYEIGPKKVNGIMQWFLIERTS